MFTDQRLQLPNRVCSEHQQRQRCQQRYCHQHQQHHVSARICFVWKMDHKWRFTNSTIPPRNINNGRGFNVLQADGGIRIFHFCFSLLFSLLRYFTRSNKKDKRNEIISKGKNALCKYEDFEILNLLNATISTCQSSPIWLGHLCPLITYFYSLVLFIGWMRMPSTALPSFSQPSMRSLQGTKRKKFSIIESL